MTTDSLIRQQPDGTLQLVGVLDFRSGAVLRAEGEKLIRATPATTVVVDCAAVEHSSSVGLSLLLAYMRVAKAAGKTLSVRALPLEMRQIAEVSGLLEILPLQA
ncbi:phospholipid transport system transporter-binding protein [Pseudomonas sp. TE3786]